MVLIINLNTAVDKTILVNDFKINHIYRPVKLIEVGGGKGINVARVLNTLNIKNTVIGFVGGNKTNTILNTLHKEKINFVPVPIHGNSRACNLIIDKKNHTETIINENGPEILKIELKHFIKLFHKVFSNQIKYLVISGSQPPGVPQDFYAQLVKYAKTRGVFTLVDTSRQPLNFSIKAKPDILKPNIEELKTILRLKNINTQILKKALVRFYKYGIKYPLVTLGKKGILAYYAEKNKFIKIFPPDIKKISTIGSGDAFTAGLIYSLIKKYNFADALKFATATASANALKIEAGFLDKQNIFRLLKKIKIS